MDSNLEIIKSLFENECQRIVECKNNKTGEILIYNTIINQKLIKLIDINILNSIKSNIIKCYRTEDRLYIVTKPHELNNQQILKEYIDKNNLSLKQQFLITEQLINLFIEIYNTTDLMQFKIINFENLSIGNDDTLYVNAYFEFKDEYDLPDNFTYKNIGNIIHYLFSKEDIVDYNISDTIPPDILKIIVKCLTREYFHPKDILKEFVNSPIYGLINCKADKLANKSKMTDLAGLATSFASNETADKNKDIKVKIVDNTQTTSCVDEINLDINDDIESSTQDNLDIDNSENNNLDKEDVDLDNINIENHEAISEAEDVSIIDIYLNDMLEEKNKDINEERGPGKLGKALKFIIPVFVIAFVTIVSIFLIKNLYNDKPVNNDDVTNPSGNSNTDNNENNENNGNVENDDSQNQETDKPQVSLEDSDFSLYLNNELIEKIGYEGKIAVLDTENYNEGNSSLLVENENDDTIKSLFAVIDFNNEKLSYMKNNQIGISAKFKALDDVDALLVVEAYKNNKLSANNSGKVQIYDDVWSQKEITIVVGEIDRVNLYLEYKGANKVWIDTIDIDILK